MAKVSSSTGNVSALAGEGLSGSNSGHNRTRICPSCGRGIGWEASSCPYCLWSQGEFAEFAAHHDPIPAWKKVLLYACSLLIPIFGIVVGAMYLGRTDEEHKSAGTICLVLGAVCVFMMPTVLAAILYVMVLGW